MFIKTQNFFHLEANNLSHEAVEVHFQGRIAFLSDDAPTVLRVLGIQAVDLLPVIGHPVMIVVNPGVAAAYTGQPSASAGASMMPGLWALAP